MTVANMFANYTVFHFERQIDWLYERQQKGIMKEKTLNEHFSKLKDEILFAAEKNLITNEEHIQLVRKLLDLAEGIYKPSNEPFAIFSKGLLLGISASCLVALLYTITSYKKT